MCVVNTRISTCFGAKIGKQALEKIDHQTSPTCTTRPSAHATVVPLRHRPGSLIPFAFAAFAAASPASSHHPPQSDRSDGCPTAGLWPSASSTRCGSPSTAPSASTAAQTTSRSKSARARPSSAQSERGPSPPSADSFRHCRPSSPQGDTPPSRTARSRRRAARGCI